MYPDNWQVESLARGQADVSLLLDSAERGLSAAKLLIGLMEQRGVRPPASYLAVIVQDLDNMGKFLSGVSSSAAGDQIEVTAAAHQDVSSRLREAGGRQRPVLEDPEMLGFPVYAGGDDLLAFARHRPRWRRLGGATTRCRSACRQPARRFASSTITRA